MKDSNVNTTKIYYFHFFLSFVLRELTENLMDLINNKKKKEENRFNKKKK